MYSLSYNSLIVNTDCRPLLTKSFLKWYQLDLPFKLKQFYAFIF